VNVLAVLSSPRRERGLSQRVVSAVLSGARAAGAETEVLYLADESPQYCIHCGHPCFQEGSCIQEEGATRRSRRVEAADALVFCAPVYCWQPNGMAIAFTDKLRLMTGSWQREGQHGRPALGIAVAGGTGSGVFPALQSIYAWLCLWKYRPLEPLPVTRFNLDRALAEAPGLGRALVEHPLQPYGAAWELMLTYDCLPYMGYGRVDEFRWLAEQIVASLEARGGGEDVVAGMRRLLADGRAAAARGDAERAARSCVEAYQIGAGAW
jgi:NAD(P)H-dependent FMN reductase